MPKFARTYRVHRDVDTVFDTIGTHLYENHPRWEAEVIEIRPLTEGPIRVGSRALMVRQDGRRRSESTYEVTRFEPGRGLAVKHLDGPFDFALSWDMVAAGTDTDLTVRVAIALRGWLRPFSPVLGISLASRSDRISRQAIDLIESRPPLATRLAAPAPSA